MASIDTKSDIQFKFLETLQVPPFELEWVLSERLESHPEWQSVFSPLIELLHQDLPCLIQRYLQEAVLEDIPEKLGLSMSPDTAFPGVVWEVTLCFTDNSEILTLNKAYRDKNESTDVLSFTLLADSEIKAVMVSLPVIQLGEIFISLEWALREVQQNPSCGNIETGLVLRRYIMERVIHGLLHLMGVNHDTMDDYNKVVAIQRRILDDLDRSE